MNTVKKRKKSKPLPTSQDTIQQVATAKHQQAASLKELIQESLEGKRKTDKFLAEAVKLRTGLFEGKSESKDLVKFLETIPPGVRSQLADMSFDLFDESNYAKLINALRLLDSVSKTPTDPGSTQISAIASEVSRITGGCNVNDFMKVQSAAQQIRRELAGGPQVSEELLKTHDDFAIGRLRINGQRKAALAFLSERLKLAAIRDDEGFIVRIAGVLQEALPALPENFRVGNFDVRSIKELLLKNWKRIEGSAPPYGLCEFSREAWRSYTAERRKKPTTESAVERARGRLKLKRKNVLVVQACIELDRSGKEDPTRVILTLKEGGQKVEMRVSTPDRQS